jgi:hypothetical protein
VVSAVVRSKTLWSGSVVWKSVRKHPNAKKKRRSVNEVYPRNITSPRTTRSTKAVKCQDE